MKIINSLTALALSVMMSCTSSNANQSSSTEIENNQSNDTTMNQHPTPNADDVIVDITTSLGDIKVRLYNDTPKHRDNFIKLINQNFYDGTLFHRVISQFMIQAGDPDSKGAPSGKSLGTGGPGYNVDAEIVYPKYFHKRGVLAAARQGDQVNPEKKSSGSQFYIVTGRKYNANQLQQMEKQLVMGQQQRIFDKLAAERRSEIMELRRNRDNAGLQKLQEELVAIVEAEVAKNPLRLTEAQRQAYSTIGGTPHLDGEYTVFGEVISGMDVVEKIETAETGPQDRPVEDIKIISMKISK